MKPLKKTYKIESFNELTNDKMKEEEQQDQTADYNKQSMIMLNKLKNELYNIGIQCIKNYKDECPSLHWIIDNQTFDVSYNIDTLNGDEFYSIRYVDKNKKQNIMDSETPLEDIKKILNN